MGTPEHNETGPAPQPRPFQFGLRTMLLATAAFAFLCGLWAWQGLATMLVLLAVCLAIGVVFGIWKRNAFCFGWCAAGLFYVLMLFPAIQAKRTDGPPPRLPNYLKQLGVAMHGYHDEYGCFPPAYVADEDGKPMHSWRVLLLPYLEQKALYDQYDFSESWDGPNNRRLANIVVPAYSWPEDRRRTGGLTTGFVVVVGEKSIFPGDQCLKLNEVGDGTANTILVVPCANSGIHWMEPRDLEFDRMSFRIGSRSGRPSIRSYQSEGASVCFADGSVRFLPKDTHPGVIKNLLTANGGERLPEEY